MATMSDIAEEIDDLGRKARSLATELEAGELAPVDIRKRIADATSHLESISADAARL